MLWINVSHTKANVLCLRVFGSWKKGNRSSLKEGNGQTGEKRETPTDVTDVFEDDDDRLW